MDGDESWVFFFYIYIFFCAVVIAVLFFSQAMMSGSYRSLEMFNKIVLLFFVFLISVDGASICSEILKNCFDIDEQSSSMVDDKIEDVESRISRLERRFRAMEQPGLFNCIIFLDYSFVWLWCVVFLNYSLAN